ncbi:MAG: glutathione S-transferase N-terminal domain-containing protein [Deltaproteobacteria bacterium]|nr:glutathione S-transferase N-terminal domain-containing protein [Deltaproteobacteria bacterium]
MPDKMQMELYFYNECGFSQRVLNTITNLRISDRIIRKNIRENIDYEKELVGLCGDKTVPTLVVDGKPMRGSEEISRFLVDRFLD